MLIKWSYYEEEEFFAEDFTLFLIWASDSLIRTEFKICESSLLSSHITSSVVVCHSGCDTNTGYCLAVVSGGCCLCWVKAGASCCSKNLHRYCSDCWLIPHRCTLVCNTSWAAMQLKKCDTDWRWRSFAFAAIFQKIQLLLWRRLISISSLCHIFQSFTTTERTWTVFVESITSIQTTIAALLEQPKQSQKGLCQLGNTQVVTSCHWQSRAMWLGSLGQVNIWHG